MIINPAIHPGFGKYYLPFARYWTAGVVTFHTPDHALVIMLYLGKGTIITWCRSIRNGVGLIQTLTGFHGGHRHRHTPMLDPDLNIPQSAISGLSDNVTHARQVYQGDIHYDSSCRMHTNQINNVLGMNNKCTDNLHKLHLI